MKQNDITSEIIGAAIERDTSFIEIYPNPNYGKFNIVFKGFNSSIK